MTGRSSAVVWGGRRSDRRRTAFEREALGVSERRLKRVRERICALERRHMQEGVGRQDVREGSFETFGGRITRVGTHFTGLMYQVVSRRRCAREQGGRARCFRDFGIANVGS